MAIVVTSNQEAQSTEAASSEAKAQAVETQEGKSASTENQEDETGEESETSKESEDEGEESESEDENDDSQEEDENQGEKKEKTELPKGIKKKFGRFKRRLSEKDQEIEFLKAELSRQSQNRETKDSNAPAKKPTDGKPKAEDFENHDDYIEALTDWKLEAREAEKERKGKEAKAQNDYQSRIQEFQKKSAEYSDENEEYEDLMLGKYKNYQFSPGITECLLESESGPKVLHELMKNKKELDRINTLGPISASREFGKIEARLSESSKQPKLTTKAPAPPNPVSGKSEKATKKSIYDSDISFKDYERIRLAEMRDANSF